MFPEGLLSKEGDAKAKKNYFWRKMQKKVHVFINKATEGDGYVTKWYQSSCYNTKVIMGNNVNDRVCPE